VKHPRSGLPPTVLCNLSYLGLQLKLQLGCYTAAGPGSVTEDRGGDRICVKNEKRVKTQKTDENRGKREK